MKLEHSYIKELLHSIESIESARPFLSEVLASMNLESLDDKFLLHYEVLFDYGFIDAPSNEEGSRDIGIMYTDAGTLMFFDRTIRLTGKGHEFIQAMSKNEVWTVIKKEFKESSVKTVYKVATSIVEGLAKKKVESLLKN